MISVRRREKLVSARKAAGLTQEKLAEVMCVDRSTVIRWEAGVYAPLPYQWPKLAKVLGRSADELRELIGLRLPQEAPVLRSGLEPAFGWLDRHVGWPPRDYAHASRRGRPGGVACWSYDRAESRG